MVWVEVEEVQDDFFECDEISASCPADNKDGIALRTEPQAEHDESDDDVDITAGHEPRTTSERQRAQNQVFKAYAANISATLTQREVQEVSKKSGKEEELSIREILAKQDTAKRITNPRDYQTELFQRARSENTIAVLDTGSGKTHIATLLLKHVLDDELEHRAKGGAHRIAFFLV